MDRLTVFVSAMGLIILVIAGVVLLSDNHEPPDELESRNPSEEDTGQSEAASVVPFVAGNDGGAKRTEIAVQGNSVSGVVISADGEGVQGASVTFRVPGTANAVAQTTSRSEGRFSIVGLDAGAYHVDAMAEGEINERVYELYVQSDRSPEPITLQLGTGPILKGRVTCREGVALSGFSVELRTADEVTDPVQTRSALTDDVGAFFFRPLRRGAPYYASVSHADFYATVDELNIQMDTDQVIEFHMIGYASMSGVVYDVNGEVSAGARVSFESQMAMTGEDGKFEFSGIIATDSPKEVRAISEDRRSTSVQEELLSPGEILSDVVIRLEKAPRIYGRVTSMKGEPIEGATVVAHAQSSSDEHSGSPVLFSSLNELGYFKQPTLSQFVGELRPMITLGRELNVRDQVLESIPRAVESARYEAPSGPSGPVQPISINFRSLQSGTWSTRASLSTDSVFDFVLDTTSFLQTRNYERFSAVTGEDGTYEIIGLWPGSFTVEASADEYMKSSEAESVSMQAGAEVELDFALIRGAIVSGRVFLPSGEPSAGSLVAAYHDGELLASINTEDDGAFQIAGLPTATLDLFSRRQDLKLLDSRRHFNVELGGVYENIEFHLTSGGKIQGQVLNEMGVPIEGASVEAHTEGEEVTREATTDTEGSFTIEELYDREFFVTAHADEYLSPEATSVVARRGELVHCGIVLITAIQVEGQVTGGDGSPLEGAYVFLIQDDENTSESSQSDQEGRYVLHSMRPSAYEIYARSADYSFNARIQFDARRTRGIAQQDIKMNRACSIRGRVLDERGQGVPGVAVEGASMPGNHGVRSAMTDGSGEFNLVNLYPGDAIVRIARSQGSGEVNVRLLPGPANESVSIHMSAK